MRCLRHSRSCSRRCTAPRGAVSFGFFLPNQLSFFIVFSIIVSILTNSLEHMDTTPRIGFTIKTLSHRIGRTLGQQLRLEQEAASTAVRSHILGYFAHHEVEAVLQSELGNHLLIRRSTMTNILDGMESEGLVTREEYQQDKRQKLVRLTEKAKALCSEHLKLVNDFETSLQSNLSDEELKQFFAITKKLNQILDTYT
ncbi:transcriptional regulator, MarR family [Sphaerochaeta globosa str. Buddy]|uniref:Transcriptional regulator, MarR family n=2 Tax=Sphaerochaeta TaxID=399320 RepID=F0RTL7_SPHGB|nr:transcriptional regulator, MarR family [Sphaerochaeta globosa str. Buddy]